ncbi:MAG: beta-lactamase family protein [Clostridia bacterium]|nr:beta-lactamase family protein [Clostridia bacterium]
MFEKSLKLIQNGVGSAFPCAAVAIGVGHTVFVRSFFGQRQIKPYTHSITEGTLFDLASLSKLVATTMVALKFIENGKLSLNDNIGSFIDNPGNYGDCKTLHLLTHTSGMPAGLPLFREASGNEAALRSILNSEKRFEPGKEVCYSCMGYIVLQHVLEKVGGQSLDRLADEYVFTPLGMSSACYNPAAMRNSTEKTPFAATELYSHNGEWATGHVHDENAYFLGGVSGNAGVFATLDDMIAFAGMCSEKGIAKDGKRFLSKEIFDLALHNYTPRFSESRGLGFQLKGGQESPMGKQMPNGSYGHTGFTGTSFYTDCETGLWGVLLTNAVHYGRDNRSGYFAVRKSFYDMIVTEYKTLRNDIGI